MRQVASRRALRAFGIVTLVVALTAGLEEAQAQRTRPSSAASGAARWKGVWEPVNYPADIHFTDVFFVTPDLGWATSGRHGEGGMLLRTTDGGANWEVQLGDHKSEEPVFSGLYFLDAKHGWALQYLGTMKYKLLRTDGENWEQVGGFELQAGLRGYAFLSRNVGVVVNGNDNVAEILRTTDGGRNWRKVFQCRTQLEVQGLRREIDCSLNTLHFPTAKVGYALGIEHGTLIVAKTTDGGVSWRLSHQDLGLESGGASMENVYFTDENTGVALLPGGRIYRTTDGGATWTGAIGTRGSVVRFADPEVGWSFDGYSTLSYTTNGGKTWVSRKLSLPARVTGFSIPRRDRAYVVGQHGMIYRYRVAQASEPTPPKAIDGPTMPTFESELDEQVEELEQEIETLEEAFEQAAEKASGTPVGGAGGGAGSDAIPFIDTCCAKRANELQATIDAVVPLLSRFSGKYRNVNLIIAGLQLVGIMPDQLADIRTKVQTLRRARGAAAAATALADVTAAIDSLRRTTRYAFQQEPPVLGEFDTGMGALPAGAPASTSHAAPPDDAGAASRSRPEAGAGDKSDDGAAKKAAEEAKKRAQDELKKRVRIRIP